MLRALFRDKIPDIDGLNPMRREPCGQEKAAAEDRRRHDEHSGHLSNDCMSVFRDTSFVEHRKQRNNGIDVIVRDLLHCKGIEEPRRHFSAVVTDNAGNYSSELPAFFIQLNGCPYINNIQILQQVLGRFDYALIRHLKLSDPKENLFTRAFAKSAMVSFTINNSEYYCSERMIRTALVILREYRLMSDDEFSETLHYLKHAHHKESDSSYSICNDFQKVLSRYICFGKLKLVNQYGPPYFQPEKRMCFLDSNYINITAETIDNSILILLKTTKKRNKLLRALQNCNILYANNNYKRNVEAEVAPGDIESFEVYSIPISFLTPQARAKVNAIAFSEFLFEKSILPETFLPIIQFNNSHAAGRMISDTTDEAESIYLSGQTRSGKTCMAANQAVIRLEAGQQVVVIDQTNAFCKEELQKFLPEAVISNQFVFWSINEKGLPVNVLSLEHCKNTRDKKKRLESILMVAASLSGDVQQSTLQRRLSGIVKGIEDGYIHWFGDILKYFDEADPNQAEIRARLETIAGDLEDLPSTAQSWGDLPQDKIIVISAGADGIRKSGRLFDILLANLYAYKQHNRPKRMTVVLDELVDLNLENSGPINTILRKGGKLHLSMLISAQHFSAEDDRLGRLIGNCSIKIFFRPMDNNLTAIAKHYKIDKSQLASLEQGECIAVGPFYSQNRKRNCQTIIYGKTFPVSNFIKKPEKCQDLEPVTAENSGGDENA